MNALLIIDMQNAYFVSPGLKERRQKLASNISKRAEEAKRAGDLILVVRTIHMHDKSTWTLNMLQDDQGFAFAGSKEAELIPELTIVPKVEIHKTRDSAFVVTDLLQILQKNHVTDITLTGVSTHSCIFQTAADAYAYGFNVRIPKDCVDDENQERADQALAYLKSEYRQNII